MTLNHSNSLNFHRRLSIKTLKWSILLLIPLETIYLAKLEIVHNIFLALKIIFDVIVIFKITQRGIGKRMPAVWLFVFYQACLLLSTIVNSGSVLAQGEITLTTCCFVLFFDYMMKTDAKSGIRALFFSFELLVYINFILLLVYPEGIEIQGGRGVWLFGQANDTTTYITCAFMLSLLYSYYGLQRRRQMTIRSFALFIVCLLSTGLTGSATSIVGMAFMLLFLMAYKVCNIKIDPFWGVIGSGVIFIAFIVLRLQDRFQYFFVNILNRTTTFSNRLRLWDMAFMWFSQKPFFGYGVEKEAALSTSFFGYSTPHNKILYTAYQGGIVLTFIFIAILVYAIVKIRKQKNKFAAIVMAGSCCALLVQMQFESYTGITFWIPFLCGMYIDQIVRLRDEEYVGKSKRIVLWKKSNVFYTS